MPKTFFTSIYFKRSYKMIFYMSTGKYFKPSGPQPKQSVNNE